MRIAFIGTGSYGTAVAHHLAPTLQQEVLIYGRNPDVVAEINTQHTNERYLGEHSLSPFLKGNGGSGSTVSDADLLMIAVPAQSVRAVVSQIRDYS